MQILQTVGFKIGTPTILEFLERYFEECGLATNTKLKMICMYLAKMIVHDYELSQLSVSQLAASALFVGLRIMERVDPSIKTEEVLMKVVDFALLDLNSVKISSKKVLHFAKSFESRYPKLKNLRTLYNEAFRSLTSTSQ